MSAPSRTPGQLKVPELKEELKKRGITPKGLKKDLVEKLEEVLQKEAEEQREAVIEKIEEALQKNVEDQKEALVEKLEVRKEAEEQREAVIEKIDAALPKDAEERKEASVEKLEEVIQKVAEEQSGNTSSYNLSQQVPVGFNSPLLGSSDFNSSVPGSNGVDSPLPVVGSTQGSSPLPSLADIRNEDYNSPPQVADTKSLLYVPHQQVAGRENAEVKGHESDCVLQAGHESALEPEKMEYDSQKEEYMEHFDSARKSPLGLVHDSEGLLHDGKEAAADDSETRHTVYSVNESGVDVCRPETLGSTVCFQNPGLKDEVERNSFDKDETLILSHSGPSMVEKHSNTSSSVGKEPLELGDAHIQCQGLDPLLDRLGAEVKIISEKGEVFHTSDKIADQIHSKILTEYQLEVQAENGNSLTGYKDENLKVPETGLDSVDMTKSEVVTVSQEATRVEDKYQSVSTNPTSYDFKSEPRHNYQVSEASIVRQDMVECETPRETDKWEIKEQGNNSGKVSKLSGPDLNFQHTERSESNPDGTENMGPRYAQSQFISMNSPTNGFEYKPKNDHNGEETDRLKQNKEENHSMVVSTCESEETVDKENTGSFEKGFKSNETDSNLAEKRPTSGDFLEHEAVKIQHISSHYTSEVLKSEHTCNTEILEAAEHKQNLAEYNYPVVMNEIKAEDQEAKVNASTFQTDGVSILTTSNIKLEEMQQGEVVSYSEGHPEYQVGHVQQNSLDQPHHESEYEPVSNFHEREAKEIDQVIENHYQCRKISVQESEQENKVSLPGFENDKLLQSCATDSSLVEEGKQEIISTFEESMKCEYSLSESIVQNSLFHESDFNLGANAEVLEGNDQHTMKMREEEHEEQEDKINELIMEGEKTSQIVFPDEWKSEPEFSAHQSQVDLDSPREMLGDSETLKLGHTKMADVAPMDVDFEAQTGKKRIYECSKEDGEPRQEPAKRQRRWNSGKNLLEAGNTKPLTTDTLKDIIPRDAAEVSVESSSPHPVVSHPAASASQCLLKAEKTSFSRPAPPPLKSDSPSNGEIQKPRIVPPPLRSPTSSLKVERFLRPFTINALKELLSETGRVRYFWIDQIKTHCYVTYSSAEEAVATRNALYNLKWPIVGGRFLIAEFVDHEEVMSHGEGQSTSLTTTNPVPPKNITQGLSPLAPPGSYAQALRSPPLPDSKAKQAMASKKDPEPEPAVYTLDDLFKKTRAKPHIYYLPLNEEQVATKLAVRSRDQQNRL